MTVPYEIEEEIRHWVSEMWRLVRHLDKSRTSQESTMLS
jgi:hypothetical protein